MLARMLHAMMEALVVPGYGHARCVICPRRKKANLHFVAQKSWVLSWPVAVLRLACQGGDVVSWCRTCIADPAVALLAMYHHCTMERCVT